MTRMTGIQQPVHIFAFLLLVATFATSLFAQDQPADEHRPSQTSVSAERQSTPASPEPAAEEKDQTEQFKHSSSVRLIGRILGLDSQRSYWIAQFVNFGIIAAVLIWAGRKALPGFFRSRTESIQKAMHEAQKASAEARARLADIESRLSKLGSEVNSMRDAAETEAAAEEQRIKGAAEEEARKIVAAAQQEIAAAAKAARRQLTAHAADLAVGLAKKQIHVDARTDQALVRNFTGQLEATENNSGKDRN
jgi:F-type H+-transporting ATPase subunit b